MLSKEPKKNNLKYIIPLALLYLTIYLASDCVAYKIVLFGYVLEPGPPFIFPLSYGIADIIAEVYGYAQAKKILILTLLFQFLYALLITFVIRLPHPSNWTFQSSYDQVFGNLLRFVTAGFFAVLISHFINIYIFSKWKILLKGKYFWIRSIGASAISGFFLIVITILIAYTGTMDLKSTIKMFFSIYGLELLYAILMVWPAWIISGVIKNKENLDVYDIKTNFNPFYIE